MAAGTSNQRIRVHLKEFGFIDGINGLPSGKGWLAVSSVAQGFQALEVLSRTEGLYYVDLHLNAHLLYTGYVGTYAIVSPDEKHVAYLGTDLTSNIWSFRR